jgi:hypothetical protein
VVVGIARVAAVVIPAVVRGATGVATIKGREPCPPPIGVRLRAGLREFATLCQSHLLLS